MKQSLHRKSILPKCLVIALVAFLTTIGLGLIGNGIWIKAKAEFAQILLNQAFERVQRDPLSTPNDGKPWHWADIKTIGRISAPRLNQSAIILNNASGEAMAFGPGHLADTPIPGDHGTSVLAAHRDTHFSWIKNLKTGDHLEVERSDGKNIMFKVTRTWIAPFDKSGINADSEGRFLALSTCYPFEANSPGPLRYIVEAEMEPSPIVGAMLSTSLSQSSKRY